MTVICILFYIKFKQKTNKNRGFTLVELIVVIVILAILAAILVPALLGYIDRAKANKDILNAKNCMTATQAELTKMYANRSASDVSAINNETASDKNKNDDLMVKNTEFAKRILNTADDQPYMFIVGLGNYDKYKGVDIHKCYTCYFAVYWGKKDRDPIFFDGTSWVKEYPWVADGNNDFEVNGEKVTLQFYVISSKECNLLSNVWGTLKKKINKTN